MDKADEMMVKRVAYYGINVSVPFIMMCTCTHGDRNVV